MTRIYTRPTFREPWELRMVVGQGVDTDKLAADIKQSGLRVFVFHEQPQLIRKPKG